MANSTTLMIVDLSNPNVAKTTIDVTNPMDVEIVTDDCVAVLENGKYRIGHLMEWRRLA